MTADKRGGGGGGGGVVEVVSFTQCVDFSVQYVCPNTAMADPAGGNADLAEEVVGLAVDRVAFDRLLRCRESP